jgi:hypothetical protein
MIKRSMMGLLFLSLIFTFTLGNAFASETKSDEIISFEDYYASLKAEYAKYGIGYEVLENNSNVVFTKELLETQLTTAREQGTEYLKQQKEEAEQQAEIDKQIESFIGNNYTNITIKSLMPVTRTDISDHTFVSPSGIGQANIRLQSTATYDVNYGYFMSVDSYSNYQYGPYVNFKSWVTTSENCRIVSFGSGTNNSIRHYVSGLLTIEYTEANTGLQVGYTSSHSVIHYWLW